MWLVGGFILGIVVGLWAMGAVLFRIGFSQGYWVGYKQYDQFGPITTAVRMDELSEEAWDDVCVYIEVYSLIKQKFGGKK
jgi:hypothetical protein